jgi:hypothetical protein
MQLIVGLILRLRHGGRALVGCGRFLPGADAGENVRGHVQRVRCGGRDLGVTLGGGQSLCRDRRVVIGVDEVVRDTRMVRVLLELDFEDRSGSQRRRKCFVGRGLRGRQIDRRENLCLVVLGKALRDSLEGVGERFEARTVGTVGEAVAWICDHDHDADQPVRGSPLDTTRTADPTP